MTTSELETLGGRCRVFRHLRTLTIQELADKAGLHFTTVWRVETGRVQPTVAVLLALSTALEIDTDVLVGARPYDPDKDVIFG